MEMPRPAAAHYKLGKLAGEWEGQETLHPSPLDPRGGSAWGRVHNRLALDGFALLQDYEQERDGLVSYSGHGVFRWNEPAGCYSLHWFDSLGQPPSDFHGSFDNDILILTHTMPGGYTRAIYEFQDDDHYQFYQEVSADGVQWAPFMEGSYTRVG